MTNKSAKQKKEDLLTVLATDSAREMNVVLAALEKSGNTAAKLIIADGVAAFEFFKFIKGRVVSGEGELLLDDPNGYEPEYIGGIGRSIPDEDDFDHDSSF